jgi:hypothetical protein
VGVGFTVGVGLGVVVGFGVVAEGLGADVVGWAGVGLAGAEAVVGFAAAVVEDALGAASVVVGPCDGVASSVVAGGTGAAGGLGTATEPGAGAPLVRSIDTMPHALSPRASAVATAAPRAVRCSAAPRRCRPIVSPVPTP